MGVGKPLRVYPLSRRKACEPSNTKMSSPESRVTERPFRLIQYLSTSG